MMRALISARQKDKDGEVYRLLDEDTCSPLLVKKETLPVSGQKERLEITITNRDNAAWEGVIHIELEFSAKDPAFYMPAFMYGTNRGESPLHVFNEYPRLRKTRAARPASPWWMVRSDRLSHPAVLVYDSGMVYGFSASPYFVLQNGSKVQWRPGMEGSFYQYAGYTCSIETGTIGYMLGYENAPWLFVDSHNIQDRAPLRENCFRLEAGESVAVALDLYAYPAENEQGINKALIDVYEQYHQSPRQGENPKTAVADLSGAISWYAWLPEEKMYSTFVFEKENGFEYRRMVTFSWINGMAIAVPQLMAALRTGNDESRRQALDCIDELLKTSMNPDSGLPYDSRDDDGTWNLNGWWFDGMQCGGHSSYVAAQGVYFLLKAYDYEKRLANIQHSDWLSYAESIVRRFESGKNAEGEYPYLWSEKTGLPVEYDSFGGVWCMAATAYYIALTGTDKAVLAGLKKSEAHYYENYVRRMVCYGTPLDTSKAVDSEGILAYIRAVRWLHALTGDEIYLDHMRDAFHYEFTFKFCYNSPIKTPPLATLGWSSCGGSVTSVCNPHIHPMSSSIIDEFLYYLGKRGDKYIRSRMMDTVQWGCQTYNTYDGEFGFGKKGWMSERFCYSEGLLTERFPDGEPSSTWLCLMPWAGACIIDGLAGDYWESGE